MSSCTFLFLLFALLCIVVAQDADENAEFDEVLEEFTDDNIDEELARAAREAAAPDANQMPVIDWSTVPEGPEVEIEILERPEECIGGAQSGDVIEVHYTASIQSTGEQFASSYDSGEPLRLMVGDQQKQGIRGFYVGVNGICEGERRLLTIPPAWGLGDLEQGPVPAGSTLLVEMQATKVHHRPELADDPTQLPASDGSSFVDLVIFVLIIGSTVYGYLFFKRRHDARKKKKVKYTKPKNIRAKVEQAKKKKSL